MKNTQIKFGNNFKSFKKRSVIVAKKGQKCYYLWVKI